MSKSTLDPIPTLTLPLKGRESKYSLSFRERGRMRVGLTSFAAQAILAVIFTLSLVPAASGADYVVNIAKASYSVGSLPATYNSNMVSTIVCAASKLDFLKYAPLSADAEKVNVSTTKYMTAPGSYVSIQNPFPVGSTSPLDLSQPVPLIKADVYHIGEPFFFRLSDSDQNVDSTVAETIMLTLEGKSKSEKEILISTETGPNTGVFVGYIQSVADPAVKGNGFFSVFEDDNIVATYEDKCGPNDTGAITIVAAAALVDPFGVVFDAATGQPVNGAIVTLIDAAAGSPATVYGDDGVSVYPSTVITGGTATDSSDAVYFFPPGGYRFPFISPGKYRLDVVPPTAYRSPSTVSTEDIQQLPGAPFAIVNPGSRGEEFYINPGPAINIDLPVDPIYSVLYLTKGASKSSASVGDFIQYLVTVENTSADNDVDNIVVSDRLPLGFRYHQGSTKIDGVAASDPSISDDGRTLSFAIGAIAAAGSSDIKYILEIVAGAVVGKPAKNIASAKGITTVGGAAVTSNTATAVVQVKEDLLSSKSIIMGQVMNGCDEGGTDVETQNIASLPTGVEGIRIYLEDGTYVVTDKKGMYHFEGLKPGTHVVQLDIETISEDYELTSCEENSRFAGAPYSQFVDLQGGTMWRADFYLSKKPKKEEPKHEEPEAVELTGNAAIELRSVLAGTYGDMPLQGLEGRGEPANRQNVEYEVSLHIGNVPLSNLRLSVILPQAVEYNKESSRFEDAALPDPDIMENTMTYRLGDAKENWGGNVRFSAALPLDGKGGELVTRAILTFDSPGSKNMRTPLAENMLIKASGEERKAEPDIILHPHFEVLSAKLSRKDMAVLDGIVENLEKAQVNHIYVTGHTDSTRIGKNGRKKYADNYKLSEARAESVGRYLAKGLGLSPSQVTIEGKGPDVPISSNKTEEGRAINRRVELRISAFKSIQWTEIENSKDNSGIKQIEINVNNSVEKTVAAESEDKPITSSKTMPEFGNDWLDRAAPGLEWAWPHEGYYPSIPSTKIAVKHDPGKRIGLFLNGEEVNPIYFETSMKREDEKVAVSLWIGLHLREGDNLFEAAEYDVNGSEAGRTSRMVHYSGPPVKIQFVPEQSKLMADGKTPPVIAIRLTDKDGHPAREGLIGEYIVAPPYTPHQKVKELQKDPLTMSKAERLQYKVGEDGIALIELEPTSKTGEAVIRFNLVNGENEIRTWLIPEVRDWVLVGLAEGTMGYNTVSGNMESLKDSDVEDKYYKDGRLAFFAKGMIKGKWLLTAAYNSEKKGIRNNDSLHGIIDPDKYYTLYGDATQQAYEAASARSLYLKIERDKFYALFGDFDTGLAVTELSRYSRSLNGFKSEMKGEKYDFNIFVSDTNQAFVKDEIRGDGTSGLYMLSRKNIVINSETITIETRDRFKSEEIISAITLSRHIDYSIDYDSGTIYFKSPIYSRDESFNPVYIVVNYESYDPSDMSYNYGGRGAARFMDGKAEVGLSHIHEGRVGGEGNLAGVDARFKLNDKTNIRAEVAATDTDFNGVDSKGSAYLAEVSHRSDRLEGKAYVREQAEDFGLGQQRGSETGTRKLGVDGAYRMDDQTRIRTDVYRQYNLSTDAVRDMAEARVELNDRKYSLNAGFRYAQDTLGNGDINSSAQVITGGSLNALDDRLILKVGHEQSLISRNENSDFPTRTMLGADYKLNDTATLVFAQEFTHGEYEDTETTRIGMRASPWSGGQLSSTVEQQQNEDGIRVFSVTGLKQSWQVTKRWSIDAGLDRSETLRHPGRSHFNTNVPASSGDSDFTAISAGAAYKEEKWSWTGRVETRDSDSEGKIGVFTGANGEIKEGFGLAASVQAFKINYLSGQKKINGNLRFGLAYRPEKTDWIILDRLDYIFDRQNGGEFDFENSRIINNLNANYKVNSKTQLSLQYGAKYVNETIDGDDYSGYTDLSGLEGRYDLTKKWDVGLRGNILHSWDARQYKYGYAPSVGYNFAKNVWVSVGYNITGFRDSDFSKADFTSEGPFIKFRMKFDQKSARDAVKWISGQQ